MARGPSRRSILVLSYCLCLCLYCVVSLFFALSCGCLAFPCGARLVPFQSRPVLSRPAPSRPVSSCPVLSRHVPSCLVPSRSVSSRPVTSWLLFRFVIDFLMRVASRLVIVLRFSCLFYLIFHLGIARNRLRVLKAPTPKISLAIKSIWRKFRRFVQFHLVAP
jgi:hypothetical protein